MTTEKGVVRLTTTLVTAATCSATILAHLILDTLLPIQLLHLRELMLQTAYVVTITTCLLVALPISLLVSKSLLKAHQLQQDVIAMAWTDHLTGLPNRAAVLVEIERAVADGVANGRVGSVLFVDLDHFKKINDTFGHAGGDAALRHAARIMRRTLGPGVVLGRFGGEEFICFIEDAACAPAIAGDLIMALRESSAAYGDQTIPVKASIGLANTDGTLDTGYLLSRADEALYIAKSSGRDCIVSYDEVALLRLAAQSIEANGRCRSSDRVQALAA
ncbi:MAG: GGDEF domain-containing protein [Bosea sp. (in: a-proteobacteria)]